MTPGGLLLPVQARRRFAASVAAFSPLSLSPALWLDGSQIVGLSDGDPVATWSDVSGNARDATQATSSKRPTFKTAILNGKPVVRFDAVDDGMVTTLTILSQGFSVWVVYSLNNSTGSGRRALQGSTNWLIGPYGGSNQVYNSAGFIFGGAATVGTFYEICVTQTVGAVTELFIGNVSEGTLGGANIPATIGLGTGGSSTEVLDGDIAEVVVGSSVWTSTDRANLHAYANSKYAI